jgi:hypothetical protein
VQIYHFIPIAAKKRYWGGAVTVFAFSFLILHFTFFIYLSHQTLSVNRADCPVCGFEVISTCGYNNRRGISESAFGTFVSSG